jgi:hypothetical protein
MITNDGKQIVAKFLLGQAPTFASYIAAGCGPEPLLTGASASISADIDTLDFEVFRVPILSKGFIKENGQEKLVLKAEMPNDQRYKITEVGVYPGANNVVAGRYDSKILITFSPAENWTFSDSVSSSAVPYPNVPIDQGNTSASIDASTEEFLFINSDSTIFNNQQRLNRHEAPRYLNRSLLVGGSTAFVGSSYTINSGSKYLQNSSLSLDLSQNLPDDKIKLAFSVVSRYADLGAAPDDVRIILQFVNNLSNISTEPPTATARFALTSADIGSNRYQVLTRKISQFVTDPNFSWANINLIKIYCSALNSETPDDDYFILLDGLRIDNVTSTNPLYSLVGYNVIATDDGTPVVKAENTSNYIEYRFGVGVS